LKLKFYFYPKIRKHNKKNTYKKMAYNLLKGKRGIITGALDQHSIAWKVAKRAHEEGAEIVLTNAPLAMRMGKINELAAECNTIVIAADATSTEDLEKLYQAATDKMGGKIDFVLHSIGMSPNIRKEKPYTDLNYDWYLKTIDVSALSFHKMLQTAYKLDAISEGGSVVALSYIAAQRVFPDYTDMAEAKAMLESIARTFGYHYGKYRKVRVNTVSQSPTITTAGKGISGFGAFLEYAEQMSPLGNASADECADYIITLFSDLTKKVTMQNLFHDGGFSFTGISESIVSHLDVREDLKK
jgi:enoyl-[acyl-carrier protein] reductase I